MRVGITGHQRIPPAAHAFIIDAITRYLTGVPDLVGVSSLAAGADQEFADLVVAAGGGLVVVVPSVDYESSFESPDDHRRFARLLAVAEHVIQMGYDAPTEAAYLAAGRRVVDESDHLLAVWDGQPARGLGGTADIVAYAAQRGKPTHVVWPQGVRR
ncbi:hypothetical protein [Humibacillus xanthopallidus]|uniref:hypothetical protein n=1 Tax=Humibacillus xanthopallidus TaxID=412689 RepID=UPI00384A4A6F